MEIKDIAERASVSTATVSYVLNNTGQVSQETRDKVMKIVRELNYKRNNIAKSLRTSRTNTIGVVVEDMTVFNSPEIIDGINGYLEEKGYHVILSNPTYIKTGDWEYKTGYEMCKEMGLRVPEDISVVGFDNRETLYLIKLMGSFFLIKSRNLSLFRQILT